MPFNVEDNIPQVGFDDWRLAVDGQVDNPVVFSLSQLQNNFKQTEVKSSILCLRGVRIGGLWSGVAISDLLDDAGVQDNAKWIRAKAYTDFTEPLRINDARQEGVIVAHSLDGKPIPAAQGGALRLIVPEKYAYKSIKWINKLTVLQKKPGGFWEKKGYPSKDEGKR